MQSARRGKFSRFSWLVALALAVCLWRLLPQSKSAAGNPEGPGLARAHAGLESKSHTHVQASRQESHAAETGVSSPETATLSFVDEAGRSLASVRAWYRTASTGGEGFTGPGLGDVLGHLELPESLSDRSVEVLARLDGFQPRSETILATTKALIPFVLERASSVSGIVIDSAGGSVADGPFVVAYPDAHPPTKAALRDAMQGAATTVLSTRASSDGTFSIDGLDFDSKYTLIAGGNGVLSPEVLPGIGAGQAGVLLPVKAVFGLRLLFPDLPVDSPSLWEPPGPQWFWDRNQASFKGVGTDQPVAVLAGVRLQDCSRAPLNSVSLLFCGEAGIEAVGPIQFRGTIAGHGPLDQELWVPRAREVLSEQPLQSRTRAIGWGTTRIRFANQSTDGPLPERTRPLGEIVFESLDGGSTFLHVLQDLAPIELAHVPVGSYSVSLSTEAGYLGFQPIEGLIEVSASGTHTVTFDLVESCSIEAFVGFSDGRLSVGEASFKVERETDDGVAGSFVSFKQSPYIIEGLIRGRHKLTIYTPFHQTEALQVDLEPGRPGTVAFVAP